MTTGEFENPFADLCFHADREFDKTVGSFSGNVSASIESCIDLTGEDNPQVLFDFVQFRNAEFNTDNSSAIKVLWEDDNGEEASVIIKGQQEGLSIEHAVDLPSQYRGPLEFRFVNHSGLDYDDTDFLNFDITLFDNLRFNQSVATDELDTSRPFLLYPNPTQDLLYIATGLAEYGMHIYDMQGREMLANDRVGASIDVSRLEAGYYVLVLTGKEDSYRQSFVKIVE